MDTNSGRFIEEKNAEEWMQRISVGETIKIKGEECEVMAFTDRTVTLKLLSADERVERFYKDEANAHDRIAEAREKMLKGHG